jgi:hypothetical protein
MRHYLSLGAIAFAVVLAGSATAQAAPPANDDYGNATTISGKLPVQVSGTNVDATKQAGEPNHGGDAGGASVWYSWTAAATGPVQIHTCNGPDLDTLLGVYTATGAVPPFTNLHEEVANDDHCTSASGLAHSSLVELNAVAGTTYKIAVDSFSGGVGPPQTGPFALRISADIPTVAIDSGPGTTTDSSPTWTFRTFGANGAVTISCTIFKEFPAGSGLFIAYLEEHACSSPFTPGTSLPEGNYELDVVATAATGESSLDSGVRAFTILPPAELTPPGSNPTGSNPPSPQAPTPPASPKKCKKGKHLKHGKCVKRKKGKKRR